MRELMTKIFSRLEGVKTLMCSYRDAWEIDAMKVAEQRHLNEHAFRRVQERAERRLFRSSEPFCDSERFWN